MLNGNHDGVKIKVVGVGGAGGNAVFRMVESGIQNVEFIALNTDVQALRRIKRAQTLAIGPATTGGMGSGGRPEVGRRAVKESEEQIAPLLRGADMVFITAGLGGGTGTGAASVVAEIAKREGALTVGVATLPFSFEGPQRMATARQGLQVLGKKVDTLIAVANDKLLGSLKGKVPVRKAFQTADDVLRQGVQGIAEIITVPGIINVDFADVKAVMANGGPSFMAIGQGKGKWAAIEAAHMALANPLFDAPLDGASSILFNVRGGKDLSLGQVHEVAGIIRKASASQADVSFGLVQDRKLGSRVSITLVATGLGSAREIGGKGGGAVVAESEEEGEGLLDLLTKDATNGHSVEDLTLSEKMF